MGHTDGDKRGDAPWPQWLARFTQQRLPQGDREGGSGRGTPGPTHGPGRSEVERGTGVGLPQSWRAAGFSEREWQGLRFLRWRYVRGQLTEFPRHR